MKLRTKRTLLILTVVLLSVCAGAYYVQRRVDQLTRLCAEAFRQHDWQKLEGSARESLMLRGTPLAWYWLGSALKGQGKFAEAKSAFEKVPLHGIRGIDAAIERMEITFHVELRPLEAIEAAQRLLERDPRLASPRRHLVYFYAMTLQRPQLLREIRRAIEYHVDLPEHYIYLLTLEDLSFKDAEEITTRWLSGTPDSPFLQTIVEVQRLRVARNEARQTPSPELTQHYSDMRNAFLAAHDASTAPLSVLETLLLLAMDRGDVPEAGRLLALVPVEAGDDPTFWRYRGWYAMRNGDLTQAEDSYREALSLHPEGWQTRHEYANILRAKGDVRSAARYQATAGLGTKLISESRRLEHVQKVSMPWLLEMATYAAKCDDLSTANAIYRRQQSARP